MHPSVSLSTSTFAVEKDNLHSLKQGQLVAILQRLDPVFKDFAQSYFDCIKMNWFYNYRTVFNIHVVLFVVTRIS